MRIVVTGSSGLIGSALVHRLTAAEHDVLQLVRRIPVGSAEARWDPGRGELDPAHLQGAHAVIHLSGAGIGDERWTEERKRVIETSRVESTALLAETLAAMDGGPSVLLSASAIGYYGDRGGVELTEDSSPGDDFLAGVTVRWEAATAAAEAAGLRVAHLRTGIVLDQTGGALGKMLLPFKLGIGGRIGDGRQWWSWIAIEDQIRAIQHLLASELSGPVNLTAPNPVTNAEFTEVLGSVLGRPTVLPTPRFGLNVLLGKELAEALLYTSARVLPTRLEADGFEFTFPRLEPALRELLGR
jgi:uncharacterized protein (TIGR01777 family)